MQKDFDKFIHLRKSGSTLNKTEYMKKALTVVGLLAVMAVSKTQAGVLWTQDFSAGGAFSSYVGLGPNQFSSSVASGYANFNTSNNNLQINTASGAVTGVYDLAFGQEAGYLQFSYNPIATGSAGLPLLVSLGNAATNYTTFGMYNLNVNTGAWSIRDTAHGIGNIDQVFTGNQTITIVLNNTGSAFSYDLGGGVNGTLGNDIYRIYVGSTLMLFNGNSDLSAINPATSLAGFKFNAQSIAGTSVVIDNIVFATTPVPEPSSYALLMAGVTLTVLMVRRRSKGIISL